MLFISLNNRGFAQTAPVITGLDKAKGTVDEILTIYGKNFNTNPANLNVSFGAAPAEVVSANIDMIKVKIPAGATFGSVAVTNTDDGLTAYSQEFFSLSYDGANFNPDNLKTQVDFQASPTLQNMCLCDLNNDGMNEIITTHAEEEEINVLQNNSTYKNTSFSVSTVDLNAENLSVTCGDLEGDGFSDLVVTSSNFNNDKDHIYILKNKSTQGGAIQMATAQDAGTTNGGFYSLVINGNQTAKVAIRDLNADGKPDIVVTDRSQEAAISIFKNQSSSGVISFATDPIIPGNQQLPLFGISLGDVNNDGKPDIVASGDVSDDLLVYVNNGENNTFSFEAPIDLPINVNVFNVELVDLDLDGKKDIVANRRNATNFIVFMNTTTEEGATPTFSASNSINSGLSRQWGMDIADMNGDGKSDIVFGTIQTNNLSVLVNETAIGSGQPLFSSKLISTNEGNRNVVAGDMNGDGKPDLAYTSRLFDMVSVFINQNCVKPVLAPTAGLGVCDTLPYTMHGTRSRGVTYSWEIDSTTDLSLSKENVDTFAFQPITGADSADFTATKEAFYRLSITDTINSTCQAIYSNIVKITRPEGFVPDKPTIVNKDPETPVCYGENFQLEAEYVDAKYIWEGPDGFTSNEQNPVIENITKAKEGTYTLKVQAEQCASATASTYIKVNEPADITIQSNNPGVIFEGGEATLKVTDHAEHTYRWKRNDEAWQQGTNTFTATQPGDYLAEIQDSLGCKKVSDTFSIQTARAVIAANNCQNEPADFEVTPAETNSTAITYQWSFGDQNSVNGHQVQHQYDTAGDYTIKLEILGNDGSAVDSLKKTIAIYNVPELTITAENGAGICTGKAANLQITGNFASFEWAHGPTGKNITVREAGVYKVTAFTDQNCSVTDSIEIRAFPDPQASVNASKTNISIGDSVQLTAKGGDTYEWAPSEKLDDPQSPNPVARPITTTTFTCTITNQQGCQDTASITINVDKTLEVDPPKVFTPNGDGKNDRWTIERIGLYEECTVQIYNRQGQLIYKATPYRNDNGWDGTNNGNKVPEGAYYYVIKCDGETGRKSGSISILR